MTAANAENGRIPAGRWMAETHQVENTPPILKDYNLFAQDRALEEAVIREGAGWARESLVALGARLGSGETIELGYLANENRPRFVSHDPRGHRIDEVRFHPAYHELMRMACEQGLHCAHWASPGPGAHVARAAGFYMQTQAEAGHGCPVTMTSAVIPALRHQPELFRQWSPKVLARDYDGRNVSHQCKQAVTFGMAMTEKQGGSDVRQNATVALPIAGGGPGQGYELVGHKYFVSAPMSDAFMVLARSPGGLSCFLMPRWRGDGRLNAVQIQRLKDKMGNASNATCEAELRGAEAWMVGEEGRGIRTIIDMVAMTRFDCIVGSAAGMRQALTQAIHYCRHRKVFGKSLMHQPLMRNVLADLALEQEAALLLAMRLARALDEDADESARLLMRLGTCVGKYWVCKRAPGHAYEAMECCGGSGYMEDTIMPRLFRESPVNAIWEGSGNVQALDMLRAVTRAPQVLEAWVEELGQARGADKHLDAMIAGLPDLFQDEETLETRARYIAQRIALALQASLMVRYAPRAVADAFCVSRLGPGGPPGLYGTLSARLDTATIVERAALR